jgi:hypothetical protein
MDIAAMGRVDWIWFFTQTYPERFQVPNCQIKNCNIFGNSLRDHTESHCCNFQGIGVVFERSISWWFEHKLQQLPLKCRWHLMYSTFEPSLVLATNRIRFACYSHCWFPGEVRNVCLQNQLILQQTFMEAIQKYKEHAHQLQSTFCT